MELSRVEQILKYFLGEEATLPQPLSRVEELLIALGRLIEEGKVTNPISIRGRVNTVNDLPSNAEPGWLYFVGLSTDTEFTEYIYLDSGRWEYLGTSMISIDTALSTTSTNPVQNSTITNAINTINELLAKKPGEITTGKQYVIDGQTVTAGPNTEVFNDYENNKAYWSYSHAEGFSTTASNFAAHAEGQNTVASGSSSHAEGYKTTASGTYSHAEGFSTKSTKQYSHAEGAITTASGDSAHSEGSGTTASGNYSHAEGGSTKAQGLDSHAEGGGTTASGTYSHAEGAITTASGDSAHSEGSGTTASGAQSHAEGVQTIASGSASHAEGVQTIASKPKSHAEGGNTKADGENSHAEGTYTTASGAQSHAEGAGTTASGNSSHAEGQSTKASSANQHVQGKFNVEDANDTYAFIIGNGSADNARHNAFAIDWNGLIYVNGSATGVNVSALPTSADFPSMTQAEYDALTPSQKTALYYFIHEDDETEEESGS